MATRAVIADNQKMFTEGIKAILTEMTYPPIKIVGVAYSLDELRKMVEFPIDLLIFELAIAENEGTTFISELKKVLPNIRIIILSNYGDPQLVRDAFMQGADGYVLKSNNSLELIQCIDTVLEGKTYLAEGLRLTPEFEHQKKYVSSEKSSKIYEDRFLLKQKLTKREKQILSLIVQFKNNKVISQELFISDQTVSAHRKRIMKKFGVNNTVNLIKFSLDHQLV
ncbi:MAG: response regulator transcription factor [Saprospiraceae bacterium]|nr:response regulator transcription factor [Saprospiraceae bacterium]